MPSYSTSSILPALLYLQAGGYATPSTAWWKSHGSSSTRHHTCPARTLSLSTHVEASKEKTLKLELHIKRENAHE